MQVIPEISVIICSIDENRYNECVENFKSTIGVEAEFIRIDNKLHKWPIAKAYNEGARQAKAPNLLFIHEDVLFESKGWGKAIVGKLAEPDCGVIGFVGSPFRVDALSGWGQDPNLFYGHLYYIIGGCRRVFYCEPWNDDSHFAISDFARVIVVDGLSMAVRKDVWAEFPFDEEWLTDFHCYDIDFCLQIAQKYKNYVYLRAEVCHYSNGNMSNGWLEVSLNLTENRWNKLLPQAVVPLPGDADKIKARIDYDTTFMMLRRNVDKSLARRLVKRYVRKSWALPRHRKHLFTVLWQYFIKYIL